MSGLRGRSPARLSDRGGDRLPASASPRATSKAKFLLEPLEPRVLLSGDSILGEVYRSLIEDQDRNDGSEIAVIVEEIDAATSAEIAAADGDGFGSAASESNPTVAWPEGWQGADADDAADDAAEDVQAAPADALKAAVPAVADTAAATIVSGAESANPDDQSAPVSDGADDAFASISTDSESARGPPAVVAALSLHDNDLGLSDSSEQDEGGLVAIQDAPISAVYEAVQARAPPANEALTDQLLAPILEEALRIWSAAGLSPESLDRLAQIEVRIADLPAGRLGWAEGLTITLDSTADGQGWLVDATENSRIATSFDLLTVVLHEIGHVLGLEDDAGPAVMGAFLAAGQRVGLGDAASYLEAGAAPVTGALTRNGNTLETDPDPLDDLGSITFTILDNNGNLIPDIEVAGADEGNQLWLDIEAIVGSLLNFDETLIVGVDLDTIWDITGLNSGTVKVGHLNELAFSWIDDLTGAETADDAFLLDQLGVVTGDIEDRGGNTALDVGNGIFVAIIPEGGTTWEKAEADVVTGNAVLGTLADANVRVVGITGASIFVGSGASLNSTLDGIETAGATGFSVDSATLKVATVKTDTDSFLAVEGNLTNAQLLGIDALDLQVTAAVKLNHTSRADGQRIDWDSATTQPSTTENLLDGLTLGQSQELFASGSASLNIGPGNVVAVVDSLTLQMVTTEVVTGNVAITGLGTVDGTIDDAKVLSFSITGASLFVGTGGEFNNDRSGIWTTVAEGAATDATGFLVSGASFSMASVKKATESFTGFEVSVTNAALLGIDALDLRVTGKVKLNQTSRTDGERIDWDSASTAVSGLLPALAIDQAQQLSIVAGASLNIGPGNVVLAVPLTFDGDGVTVLAGLRLDIAVADVVTGNGALGTSGTLEDANVLTFEMLGASLFVGTGAQFNGDRSGIWTTVAEGAATDATGFLVSGASFSMASVKKGSESFTGLQVSVTNAALLGVNAIDLQVTGTVKLNQTSRTDGQRIDWDSATTDPAGLLPALAIDQAQQLSIVAGASLNIGPGNVVLTVPLAFDGSAMLTGLRLDMATADVVTGNEALGTSGTLEAANVLTFQVLGASLFVGTGAQLNAGRDGIETTGATGFLVSGASFSMASVKQGTESFTGLEVSVTNAALLGVSAVDLQVTGTVKLNQTSRTDGERIDWDSATTTPGGLLPALAIDKGQQLSIVAGASLNIGPGNVLLTVPLAFDGSTMLTGLRLDMATADVVTGNGALGTSGALADANVLVFEVLGASLFVGTGAQFNGDRTGIETAGATGFSITNASFSMASVKKGTESFTGLQVSVTNAALVGVDALDLQVTGTVKLNQTSRTDGQRVDWDSATTTPGGLLPALAIDKAQQLSVVAGASLNIGPGNVVLTVPLTFDGATMLTGLRLDMATANVDTGNTALGTDGTLTGANVLVFQVLGAGLFVGTGAEFNPERTGIVIDGAVGFSVADASFSMVSVKSGTTSFTGLEVSVGSAALVGIDGFALGMYSATAKVNLTSVAGGPKIDWDSATSDPDLLPELDIDQAVNVDVYGTLVLNAFNVVIAKGSFRLQLGTVTELGADEALGGDDDTVYQAMVLTLGENAFDDALPVEVFIGVGAALDDNGTAENFVDDELDLESGIGFHAELEEMVLITLKDNGGTTATSDDKNYLGLELSNFSAELIGIDGLVVSITQASVKVNQATDTDTNPENNPDKLDWTEFFANTEGLAPVDVPDLAATDDLLVEGILRLEVGDFVQIRGGFAFTRSTDLEVEIVGGAAPVTKTVQVVTIGMQDVNVFAGAGPYFVDIDEDGAYDEDPNPDAAGLLLKDVTVAIALFKPTNTADRSSYYAVRAEAQAIELPGLNLGSESFSLTASGYRVEVNGGKDGVNAAAKPAINFAALGMPFTVATGPTSSLVIDYVSPMLRVAIERATLIIDEYVYINGGFAFTKLDSLPVKLSNAAPESPPTMMSAYAFGAGSVDLFVGNGPYFVDSDLDGDIDEFDTRDEDAVGLAMENVNFGLLLMRPTLTPASKYIALKATADFAGLVGIDGFTLEASDISVEYNSVSGSITPNVVVDFEASFEGDGGYLLDTGNGELLFDFTDKLLRASADDVQLQIGDYVFVRGSFAFEQGPQRSVTLSDDSTKLMTTINVGAKDVTMFFGINGPYWEDANGNGDIDAGETNDDAVGLAISDADLALALLRPVDTLDKTRYVGLNASAEHVGFVGTDVFALEASMVVVELNLVSGTGTDSLTPVVDFEANFPGEYTALFAAFADGDDTITVEELNAALLTDLPVDTEAVTSTEELIALLNIGGAPQVDELKALLEEAFHDAIDAADADGDGKLDPAGHEVLTGTSTSTYIAASQRQIHASADDVLVNVAEFVYVNGSIAIDLGSRETVTIRTGIPSSVGALAGPAVAQINAALDGLEAQLNGLRDDLRDALTEVITDVKEKIRDEINNIVDDIFEQLEMALEQASAFVSSNLEAALESVTSGFSANSLIDPLLASITNQVPEGPLRTLVSGILSPIKDLLTGFVNATLEEALSGALERIGSSIGAALQAAQTAIGDLEAQVKAKIFAVIDPQITRIEFQLQQLISRLDAAIAPIFLRLQSITNIEIGEDFSTIESVEVDVTAIGIRDANAFIGVPPEGGLDWSMPIAEQDAIGLFIQDLDLALGIFQSPVIKTLPRFIAAKIDAEAAGFVTGGLDDVLTILAEGIEVRLNIGGTLMPLAGPATIDFVASFPAMPAGGGNPAIPAGYAVQTGTTTEPIYLDFEGEVILASVERATIRISDFVHIVGSFAFEKGQVQDVQVTGGLLTDAAQIFLDELNLPEDVPQIPALGGDTTELSFITIGASNVHAFVGIDGPYWTDLDDDREIGWSFDTATLASRTITAVESGSPYSVGQVLADDEIFTLSAADGWIQLGSVKFGDVDNDGLVDAGETQEINAEAKGLILDDLDFGMAIMRPTLLVDFARYFALVAEADQIALVGIDGVTVQAHHIRVELNQSSPSIYGVPLFPVVDFAATFPDDERQALFDIFDTDGIGGISAAELTAALGGTHTEGVSTVDQLVDLLDIGGAPPDVLSLDEVLDQLTQAFKDANLQHILDADADGDEKFDPIGFEVKTGGTPVYLSMDSPLIRAQGFVDLKILDNVFISGSVAFELGPTQEVTLTDGSVKEVTTMTIGAANVTAFVGINGPYWTDGDGDHSVDPSELNPAAVGFHITDLDVGIMLMASVEVTDLGLYLAAKLGVHSFGLVGIPGLTATGTFDVALNIGIGTSGLAGVDFVKSFSEAVALFELLDTTPDGIINEAEQNAALAAGFIGAPITSVAQLVAVLDAGGVPSDPDVPGTPPDGVLNLDEVLATLRSDFKDAHRLVVDGLDVDGNGRINAGFELNTGNPLAPVVLDFDEPLISIQLGGEISLQNVFRMSGIFLFEIDSSGLKAFVAAGLEIGPDIGASGGDKLFSMNALGALVITGNGVAADLQISVTIGGALSEFLQLDATARLVFNTTGVNQPITIPAKYVDFLRGDADVPATVDVDTTLLTGLVLTDEQFTQRFGQLNPDGSATYTIPGGAPLAGGGNAPNGSYLLATFHGELIIASMFEITADFRLLLSSQRFELAFTGSIELGGFGSFTVTGGAVVDDNGFAAYGGLFIDIDLGGVLTVEGSAELKINTATSGSPVLVNGQPISPNTYKVEIDATLTLFGFISATGDVAIGVENSVFSIEINELSIDLFILSVDVSGYIRSNGQFSLSGELLLDLEEGGFGITGGVGVSIGNSGFSGYGSVGIVVFGETFNIASAELSVNSERVFIRAEGPLSVYLEVTIHSNGDVDFDGGLGFLDDVIGAIEDVVNAVGSAVVDAVNAVGEALTQLGEAILELGEAIGDAIEGFINDVAGLIEDIGDWVTGLFSSSRTVYNTFPQSPKYSYSAFMDGSILRINMNGGALTEVESPLALAFVNGQVIVDGPNVTRNVKVAEKQDQHRHWDIISWGPWHNTGSPYGAVRIDIEYSNLMAFTGVTSIVITGTGGHDTIVLDPNSMGTIPTTVFGGNGNDLIITGNGNDYVEGGEGDDRIFTNGGRDIAFGQGGHDVMVGGTGNDVLMGGSGNDKLDESQNRGNDPNVLLGEQNILDGGDGNDVILGSPGRDTIIGGAGNDHMMGLNHDDTYLFSNGYGTDTFADYFARSVLDFGQVSLNDFFGNPILSFGGVTVSQIISVTDDGLTATAGAGNTLFIEDFIAIGQVSSFDDFEIVRVRTGTGADQVTITALPEYRMDFVDTGGSDTYHLDLSVADVAQSVARVDIVDDIGGNPDRIELDVNSTGFHIHLHPQAVLLNNLNLTFSTGIEQLWLTDSAATTTITTAPTFDDNLLVKNGVRITQENGGQIEFLARDDFILQAGALITTTTGDVIVRADTDEAADLAGALIDLLGTINGDHVFVRGWDDNDTVNVGNVTTGSETTIGTFAGQDVVNIRTIDAETTVNAGDGNDTVNVGTSAPVVGGTVDGIRADLNVFGDGGTNVLNVDDTGEGDANTGTLTGTTISGLEMADGIAITYGTIATLNIGLGANGDTFTIESTHTTVTNLDANDGADIINVRTISGATTVNGGSGSDTITVGGTAQGVDGIGALLTINGNDPASGSDWLYVDDSADESPNTGFLTATTIIDLDMLGSITYGTIEHLIILLGSGGNTFTIDGTHGGATLGFEETTTIDTGSSADVLHVNDVTDVLVINGQPDSDTFNVNHTSPDSTLTLNGLGGDDIFNVYDVVHLLFVNGGAGADTINVYGTSLGSTSTLNGDSGNDIVNVRAMNGTVNVNGGADSDVVNAGSEAPALPGAPTTPVGTIDAINGLLTVNGGEGAGIDVLNVDDSGAADDDKFGTLTASTLRDLGLEEGIDYSALEILYIWLAAGDNGFTINGSHGGSTTVNTAGGEDTVDINDAGGLLTVNTEEDNDVVNVRATSPGSEVYLNGNEGADTFNLSNLAPALPAPTSGVIDDIKGLVVINGGSDADVVNVDDSANTANKAGTLTSSTLRGLEMPQGVDYYDVEDFNLWLGTGTDGLFIDSTHAGTTDVFAGDGNATVNQRDDTIAINGVSGVTTVHGQGGNDFFHVGVAANDDFFAAFEAAVAAANDDQFNALFHRTHANALHAVLNLHGEGGSDVYTVNLAGQGNATVNAHDNGAPDDGVDTLIVNGADLAGANPNDTFLLRRDLVALLNTPTATGFTNAERVNYNEDINARLIVNGVGGNDKFVVDDNSSITTLDGGDGDDIFQIGQVFGTPRDGAAGLAPADQFATTPVIIGVIRDPISNAVIFDPTTFNPVTDVLSSETIALITAAIEYQRDRGLALNGVAYVSPGATHATTAFGGAGEDTFNVYHNKAALRLEGEADNDQFTVRAFVTLDLSGQGDTEVNGGAGTDTIHYAINAPVSLDGGAGFDKVVVLGTPFNDSFVVSSEGIFGAGLNVKFTNVESAELDTLEGDDTIFVLGTSGAIVTTVIGGLGNDTIEVMGDVVNPIISSDLLGRSGVITHGLSNGAGANGVPVNVLSPADSLVKFEPTGTPLVASEEGAIASYSISLVAPDADLLALKPVYLTVSAGVVSSTDRRLPNRGEGVLVSVNGGEFTNAVVLTFDGTTAESVFEIRVKAIDDDAAEGPRVALISHSVNSDDPAYDDLAMIDVFVEVVDNDQPGLDLRHLTDTTTEVLEGTQGFTDTYSVALTAAPGEYEVVTVTFLITDGQVTTGVASLTFDADNWHLPQTVLVTAFDDDMVDGIEFSTILHRVTSAGGSVYADFVETPGLTVTVYDDETPGTVVQQTGGSTVVVEDGAGDTYRVRLTSAPAEPVTLTLRTDMQTLLSAGFATADESGDLGYFEYTYVFDDTNWDDWLVVDVSANPGFTSTEEHAKAFAPQDQNLDQIRGPLIIEGGIGAGEDRALVAPVLLPLETNVASDQTSLPHDEADDIDVLNVFHTDNTDADEGALWYRTGVANEGLALTGFEMGGNLVIQGATYGGGITLNGFEIVEVLLGKGNESLTINDTGDRDEKNPDIAVDPATITAIHGGGGNDTITIIDRGEGPLVVYGDTSEVGTRYSNNGPAASIHGTNFTNPGIDTIDASEMAEQGDGFVGLVVYGGPGNDVITGSQDDDHLAGGAGEDTINGEGGADHIYGDSHFNVDLLLFAQGDIDAMFTVPVTGDGYADTINAGAGNDVVFGDHGVIDQDAGTRRIETTGSMVAVRTTSIDRGEADTIHGDAGNDFIFGGVGGDTIFGDLGSDLVFGDHGSVVDNVDASVIGEADGAGVQNASAAFTYTSDTSAAADDTAGNDTIYGGSLAVLDTDTGRNILLGQQGSDTIYGGGGDDSIYGGHNVADGHDVGDFIDGAAGDDVILGDNGLIERTAASTDPRFAVLQGDVIYDADGLAHVTTAGLEGRRIELFDHDDSATNAGNFGADTIAGGADDDMIFGQLGADTIHGDGRLSGTTVVTLEETIDGSDFGGDDYLEGNGGDDTIYGGLGQDDIVGGSSSHYNLDLPSQRPDGADTIFGGNGDMIDRSTYGDGLHARDSDMILGDNGNIHRLVGLSFNYDNYGALKIVVRAASWLDYTPGGADYSANALNDIGGDDVIRGESGDDFIYGQKGDDVIFGDAGDDDLIGGWGNDWISGGTGDDGVLGDDGRIYTSRNGLTEPLYGLLSQNAQTSIATPGNHNQATIFVLGQLHKTVNLEPFNVIDADSSFQDPLYDAKHADDIIYGGLGNDFLHGGSGDDAISGAEALPMFYAQPLNPGDVLDFGGRRAGEFFAYDEFDPLRQLFLNPDGTPSTVETDLPFLLNFDASEGPLAPNSTKPTDGEDMIFGDLGNDWIVGGTGRDWMFGGFGDDLINADDDHDSTAGGSDELANNIPDGPETSYEDFAYGGAGRDVLIANTGGDRLIDWAGEFNSYLVPFSPFGMSTVSRMISPALQQFLYDLSRGAGADRTRVEDGGESSRNGEPFGEIGLVNQSDNWWQEQTGAPDDKQPGNTNGKRDVLRAADFNNGSAQGFSADSGSWTVQGGALLTQATSTTGDAVAIYHVGEQLPSYYELQAVISTVKPTGGWKANSYVIFDYHSPTDFKFAGINVSTDKIEMGHRTAQGWVVDVMASNVKLRPDTNYNMLVAVNGLVVTVTVNNSQSFSYAFAPRMIDGVPSNLNWGYVGFGSQNAQGKLDNVQVKVLERPFTLNTKETFADGAADLFAGAQAGDWQVLAERYFGAGADPAMSLVDLGLDRGIQANARTELTVMLSTGAAAGFVFDLYSADDFKFVLADTAADRIFIGHKARGAWTIDASAAFALDAGRDYKLLVSLAASTVSVMADDKAVVGHAFNAVVVDGAFGTMARGGAASFDDFILKTSDSRFKEAAAEMLLAESSASVVASAEDLVTEEQLAAAVDEAIARWSQALGADVGAMLEGVVFAVGYLDGLALAQTVGKVVMVDADAAGHGWFIDPTVSDDKEFAAKSDDELRATPSSAAYGRIDLLTVVMHEIGHLLGFGHDDPAAGAVMDDTLPTGVRHLPPAGAVAPNGNESAPGGNDTQHVSFNSSGSDAAASEEPATQDAAPETTSDTSDAGAMTDESRPATGEERPTTGSAGADAVSGNDDSTSTAIGEPTEPTSSETTVVDDEGAPAETPGGESTAQAESTMGSSETSETEPVLAALGSQGNGRGRKS